MVYPFQAIVHYYIDIDMYAQTDRQTDGMGRQMNILKDGSAEILGDVQRCK